jgi:hypothetical protein
MPEKKKNKTKSYINNPITGRPILMYGKQHMDLIKKNILKSKYEKPQVITFDINESNEVLDKMKNALPVKEGTFLTRYKNKIITKNASLSNQQLLNHIIETCPSLLEQTLEEVNDDDTDDIIKQKFTTILNKKLLS